MISKGRKDLRKRCKTGFCQAGLADLGASGRKSEDMLLYNNCLTQLASEGEAQEVQGLTSSGTATGINSRSGHVPTTACSPHNPAAQPGHHRRTSAALQARHLAGKPGRGARPGRQWPPPLRRGCPRRAGGGGTGITGPDGCAERRAGGAGQRCPGPSGDQRQEVTPFFCLKSPAGNVEAVTASSSGARGAEGCF